MIKHGDVVRFTIFLITVGGCSSHAGPHPAAVSSNIAGRWHIVLVTDTAYSLDSVWNRVAPVVRHDRAEGQLQLSPCVHDCRTTVETSYRVDSAVTADLPLTHSGSFDIPLERLGIDADLLAQQRRFFNGQRPVVARSHRDGTLELVINSGHYHNYLHLTGTPHRGGFEGTWYSQIYYPPLRGHFRMTRRP